MLAITAVAAVPSVHVRHLQMIPSAVSAAGRHGAACCVRAWNLWPLTGAQRRSHRRFHSTAATTHTQHTQHAGGQQGTTEEGRWRERVERAGSVGTMRNVPLFPSPLAWPTVEWAAKAEACARGTARRTTAWQTERSSTIQRESRGWGMMRVPFCCAYLFLSSCCLLLSPFERPSLPFSTPGPPAVVRLQPFWSVLSLPSAKCGHNLSVSQLIRFS